MFFGKSRRPWILMLVIFSLLLGMVPLFTQTGGSSLTDLSNVEKRIVDSPADYLNDKQEIVEVGIYILSVGNLDTTTGRYYMDFFLNFNCRTPGCEPGDFDIMNAAEILEPDDQTSVEDRANGERYYRIKGELQANLNLRDFPFDRHSLIVELEDKNKDEGEKKFAYVATRDMMGIDPQVYVSGWDLRPRIQGEVRSHPYAIYDESYSRARFTIQIEHSWFSSFMKGLFAAIVIVAVGMLSFLMDPDEAQDRINLTSGTLASAIFYHMTLTASIPPVGYLTYADRFMILQYVFITLSLAVAVALFLLQSEGKRGTDHKILVGRIHRSTRWLIPLLWIIAMVVMHVTTLVL
jgi:hypothetical protein